MEKETDPVWINFENELEAARVMIERDGESVLVLGVRIEKTGAGGYARSVTPKVPKPFAQAMADCLRREADRIEGRL